jgi:hypothetical protein
MQLNSDGEVYKHCCDKWTDPYAELWTDREDDKIADIWCLEHPQVHLGYASDLDNKKI